MVQDPEEALYPGMPRSAIENHAVDVVMSIRDMGPELVHQCISRAEMSMDALQDPPDDDAPEDDAMIEADINQFEMKDRPLVEEHYRKQARAANQKAEFMRKVLGNGHADISQPPSGSDAALDDLEP